MLDQLWMGQVVNEARFVVSSVLRNGHYISRYIHLLISTILAWLWRLSYQRVILIPTIIGFLRLILFF